jgi:hypothetical protein
VVYLNGGEAFRSNMPEGLINYTTLAMGTVDGVNEQTFFETVLGPGRLVAGANLLAVELHQRAANSSDVSFDLELSAEGTLVPRLSYWMTGDDQLLLAWPAAATGWKLLVCPNLSEANGWVETGQTPTVTNGLKVITITPSGTGNFYQLRRAP